MDKNIQAALRAALELDWGLKEKEEGILFQIINKSDPATLEAWFHKNWETFIELYPLALEAALSIILENKTPDDKYVISLLTQIVEYIIQKPGEGGYYGLIFRIVEFLSKSDPELLIALLAIKDIANSRAFDNLCRKVSYTLIERIYKNDILQNEQIKLIPSKIRKNTTPEEYLDTLFRESRFYKVLQNVRVNLSDKVLNCLRTHYITYILSASNIHKVSDRNIVRAGNWYINRGNTPLSLRVGLNLLHMVYKEAVGPIVNTDFWVKIATKAAEVGLPFEDINIFPADLAILGLPAYFQALKENTTNKALACEFIRYLLYYGNYWGEKLIDTDYDAPTSVAYREVLRQLKGLETQPTHIQIAAAKAAIVNYTRATREDSSSAGQAYIYDVLSSVKRIENIKPFLITLTNTSVGRELFLEIIEELLNDNVLSLDKWVELMRAITQ